MEKRAPQQSPRHKDGQISTLRRLGISYKANIHDCIQIFGAVAVEKQLCVYVCTYSYSGAWAPGIGNSRCGNNVSRFINDTRHHTP